MRRRRGTDSGSERDAELGRALRELDEADLPEYPDGFWAGVWAHVDAAEDAAPRHPSGRARRPRPAWLRRPVLAAAGAAVAAVAIAAVVVLVGLPGTTDLGGPEEVSAAEVIEKTLRAISRGTTLDARIVERELVPASSAGDPQYTSIRSRLRMRSDGSYRLVQTEVAPVSVVRGRPRKGFGGSVYHAPSGMHSHYVRGWDDDARGYVNEVEMTQHWPVGPPDAWVSLESGLSSVSLALQASDQPTVAASTFRGRPVWVLTAPGLMAVRDKTEIDSVTIDRQTCLPLRVQARKDGVLQLELTWTYVSLDEPLPDDVFTRVPTNGARIARLDGGFRRLPLERIASSADYLVLLPTRLPAGYHQQWVAAAREATTANGVPGTNVAAVQYVRGFDALTITTRTVREPAAALAYDPLEWETAYAEQVHKEVPLTRGAFAGSTARLVVAPGIMIPHLYAVKDHAMLTVAGGVTADELVEIAESLQRYRP